MRKVGLATGVFLTVLVATCVTAQAAPAVDTTVPRPAPLGFQSGAFSSPLTAPMTGLRAPASVALAPVTCDGKFDVAGSPNGTGNNYLMSASAINANDVWAVGNSTSTTHFDKTLAEHWNGTSWTVVSTPNASAFHNDLTGVSAISSNDVWAVGTYQIDSSGNLQTFAEHWNGTIWSLDKSTFNPTFFSILSAVTAVSSTDVWAVGTYYNAGFQSLTEHWNGSIWSWFSSPSPNPSDNELLAVSAWSSTDIWAVGEFGGTSTTTPQSLAEHWNGSAWSSVSTPNLGGLSAANVILGVSALEGGHAVGVGFGNFVSGSAPRRGEAWDLLTGAPSTSLYELGPGAGDNALLAVARSGAGVWAVGYWRNTTTSARQTLVIPANWDSVGHTLTWGTSRLSASPSSINNALIGVAAISPSVFWATGYSTVGTVDKTLTELYCGVHFNLVAPGTAATGVPFSLNVTAANADASTATGYVGTVHFTSTDPLAALPTDYTFTSGDAGTHTFSVTLNSPYNRTIMVSDTVTPFVNGSATTNAHCPGACQSAAGTPGSRGVNPGPGGSPGTRTVNPSASGAIGPRAPQSMAGVGGLRAGTPHSASSAMTTKTVLRIGLSSQFRVGVKTGRPLATSGLAVMQERDPVLVAQRSIGSSQESDLVGSLGVGISVGLIVFALLAIRRRRSGEELSVHNKA